MSESSRKIYTPEEDQVLARQYYLDVFITEDSGLPGEAISPDAKDELGIVSLCLDDLGIDPAIGGKALMYAIRTAQYHKAEGIPLEDLYDGEA